MIERVGRFFRLTPHFDNPLAQQRANGLFVLTWLLVLGWAIWLALVAAPELIAGTTPGALALPVLAGPLALVATLIALQTRRLALASWLFVGLLLVLCLTPTLDMTATASYLLATPAQLVIPLVAAGLLLDRRGLTLIILLVAATVGLRAYMENNALGGVSTDLPGVAVALVAVAALLLLFGGQLSEALRRILHERSALRGSSGFVHTMMASRDESALLMHTVDLLRDEMGYPHAQIFIIYDNTIQRIVRRGLETQAAGMVFRVPQADQDVITALVQTRAAVLSSTLEARSRLVAPAQTALTLPVQAGERLLAALDVHSTRERFSDDEVKALTDLAAQLGAHLAELRLVADLRQTVREQEAALMAGPQRGANRRLIAPTTRQQEPILGFNFENDAGGTSILRASQMTASLQTALDSAEPFIERIDDIQRLHLPVKYRGEKIGAMTFDIPAERPLGPQQVELARIVSERFGQAVENARLFEQSQSQAQREHKASEVANTLISATDVRAVLALAAETFNEAMGAVSTRVVLQPEQAESTHSERPEGVAP
jgi:GAF domain-containing protein